MIHLPFEDRSEAGRLLAAELLNHRLPASTIVLALPRGGLPVAKEVAKAFGVPLDVVIVRKLGVPWRPELAMGAIAGGSFMALDAELILGLRISSEHVDEVAARERLEVARREKLYRGHRPPLDLSGRTVVLIDDGLATGSTMLVGARYAQSLKPRQLLIAVPVGSREACRKLRKEADEVVCLATPEPFIAVGEWYKDFRQVTDAEVQRSIELSSPIPSV